MKPRASTVVQWVTPTPVALISPLLVRVSRRLPVQLTLTHWKKRKTMDQQSAHHAHRRLPESHAPGFGLAQL